MDNDFRYAVRMSARCGLSARAGESLEDASIASSRPICPAVVPETDHPPLPGIVLLIGLLVGGLTALVAAGVIIAGGIGAVVGIVSG